MISRFLVAQMPAFLSGVGIEPRPAPGAGFAIPKSRPARRDDPR
jgi:hypothetical protein